MMEAPYSCGTNLNSKCSWLELVQTVDILTQLTLAMQKRQSDSRQPKRTQPLWDQLIKHLQVRLIHMGISLFRTSKK